MKILPVASEFFRVDGQMD